jgi:hypothetical protein
MPDGELPITGLDLYDGCDVHVVEHDKPVPRAAIGVHDHVLIYSSAYAGDDKSGERGGFPGFVAVLPETTTSVCDVYL